MVPSVRCRAEGSSLSMLPKNGEKLTLSLGSCWICLGWFLVFCKLVWLWKGSLCCLQEGLSAAALPFGRSRSAPLAKTPAVSHPLNHWTWTSQEYVTTAKFWVYPLALEGSILIFTNSTFFSITEISPERTVQTWSKCEVVQWPLPVSVDLSVLCSPLEGLIKWQNDLEACWLGYFM